MKRLILWAMAAAGLAAAGQTPTVDAEGRHINAHGGCVVERQGTYYWYGEHRGDGSPGSRQLGVACYSSTDLQTWTNRGIVLTKSADPASLLCEGSTIERPKVAYCEATGQYVMWFHHELAGHGYGAAFSGVAVAREPTGPFVYLGSGRVNPGHYPANMSEADRRAPWDPALKWWTPEWRRQVEQGSIVKRDLYGGQMARDMALFVDDDGKAYHIYSSEENLTLHIAELDSTYTRHTGRYVRIFPGGHNEAPAPFKHGGKYWMIASGCTGWAPNAARLMTADSIMGEWTLLPNPCRGPGAETTFGAQSTYVVRLGTRYVLMADRWNPANLASSAHLWLPIEFDATGTPFVSAPGR